MTLGKALVLLTNTCTTIGHSYKGDFHPGLSGVTALMLCRIR